MVQFGCNRNGLEREEESEMEDEERAEVQLKFRVKQAFLFVLRNKAKQNGRSLNAEINDRLEKSFKEVYPEAKFTGDFAHDLGVILAQAISAASNSAGVISTGLAHGADKWCESPYAYDQVTKAVNTILERFRPKGPRDIKGWIKSLPSANTHMARLILSGGDDFFASIGAAVAESILESLCLPDGLNTRVDPEKNTEG